MYHTSVIRHKTGGLGASLGMWRGLEYIPQGHVQALYRENLTVELMAIAKVTLGHSQATYSVQLPVSGAGLIAQEGLNR